MLPFEGNPLLREYISQAKIRSPQSPKKKFVRTNIQLPEGKAVQLLEELRDEQGRLP